MSDLSYPEHPRWGSTLWVLTGESHLPLQESGAQEQSEHWDCTGKEGPGMAQEAAPSSSKGRQHILQALPFPGAQQQPRERELSKSSAGK